MSLLVVVGVVAVLGGVYGIDNGLGRTPPMGWRSWNQFQCAINQTLIESMYQRMVQRTRKVDGVPTSLLDLGYQSAGIDDCWQECNSGPAGKGFHNASGYPIVNATSFPDMKGMTAKAKALGIRPGWYGNNCHCSDQKCNEDMCFVGDVQATLDFGFESIKLDGCGKEENISRFAELFNATGRAVMIENCHNGPPPSDTACPMNFFRSSTDIRPTFGSVLSNLRTTPKWNAKPIIGPGCWAYPDMLEVGVTNTQRADLPPLTFAEMQSHFGAWCIVSSPLILGMDLTDEAEVDRVWPIIANKEAIAVNQAWVGDNGNLLSESTETVGFENCDWGNKSCSHPTWMVWTKRVSSDATAVLLMNNLNTTGEVSVDFSKISSLTCPPGGCNVRDIWNHRDLGVHASHKAVLAPHASAFLRVSST